MNIESTEGHAQELRDQLAEAIEAKDLATAEKLLTSEPLLANADLRTAEDRNQFSDGHPLHRASAHNDEQMALLLLKHGSHPDAPGPDAEDRPVHGMPLHWSAAEHRNYRLANVLLDHGATPNSYPNCDKATIERMFYHAREAGVSDSVVRRSFAKYLPDQAKLESRTTIELAGNDAAEAIKLFARMVDLGGQPPFSALVREGFDDLLFEIAEHSQDQQGTPHDHPNSRVLDNIAGASRWYGYPQLVRRLMEHPSYQYSYGSALSTISVAIGSHNRDGDYAKYREIIVMQLEALKSHGDLKRAQEDAEFQPLHAMATDFTWHENYGYRADIAKPECYVDLAELFVSWGFDNIEHRDEKNHSPLSAAVKRGHHPGIATYIQWLLDKGADLRAADPDEVNPTSIAKEKGHDEILALLEGHTGAGGSKGSASTDRNEQTTAQSLFWEAVCSNDLETARKLLEQDSSLVSRDFRPENERSLHSDGFPLHKACLHGHSEMARLLVKYGADVDAKSPVEERRDFGMPLWYAVDRRDYELANFLLDHGADVGAWAWANATMVERLYEHAVEEGAPVEIVRKGFSTYLGEKEGVAVGDDAPESVKLLDRVLAAGGQPSPGSLVQAEYYSLVEELLKKCPEASFKKTTMFEDLCGTAAWFGRAKVIEMAMEHCPNLHSSSHAKRWIGRAIVSHNRFGSVEDYYALIQGQIQYLKDGGGLAEAIQGDTFLPHHKMAKDYLWPTHLGYGESKSSIRSMIELSELLVSFGFEVELDRPNADGVTLLDLAEERREKEHPGMDEYIAFLKSKAEL